MNVIIASVAIGGWYPRGISRMIEKFHENSPGYTLMSWINAYPFGSEGFTENGWNYGPYCAKPFAALEARRAGADIVILMDAAFYPIRSIHPLVEHIAQTGYFFCKNGYKVGEWCSDRAMERLGQTREKLMAMEEISSYCVGLNFADGRSTELLHRWCGFAADRLTFAGPHTAPHCDGRNKGFVSADSRVRGHRHDQTALSVLASQIGMTRMVERPRFTAYLGSETSETVLINNGGIV